MLPETPAAGAIPPPPPPPPRRSWIPWVVGTVLAAAAAVVVVLVVLSGDDTTSAGSTLPTSTSSTEATSTTAPTTTEATTTSGATTTTTTEAATTTEAGSLYNRAALRYFEEIAGQAEYGGEGGVIHKWVEDVRLQVFGDPTRRDLAVLDRVIADLNALTGPVGLSVVESEPNLAIHFVPESEFSAILPEYVPVNMGFVYIWWDDSGAITNGVVLISTTGITPDERAHLIREEVTQSLGLLNDSDRYPDSMFQIAWTTTNRFSAIDRTVIEMLYRPEITPGMSTEDALAVLEATPAD